MNIKPPLIKSKTDKSTPDKRRDSQLSIPCLTEPNPPYKETSRCSELPLIPPERPSVERARLQKMIKEKEACALDYLRGLSDEESDLNDYERKRTLIDEDLDPLNDPDRLSPFMQSTRRQMSQPNILSAANSTQTKFPKKIRRKSKDQLAKKDISKRVQSEPDEKTLTRTNTKSQSCQFTLYDILPKEPLNRVNIGTDLIELPGPLHRASTLNSERQQHYQNIMTEPDYHDITAPAHEHRYREMTNCSENSKAAPPILQVRRLVGQNYTRILQGMKEYRDTGVMRDMRSIRKNSYERKEPGSSSKKALQPSEKKYAVPSTFRHVSKHIVMVGRSVSVSKFPGDFENDGNRDYSSRRLSIEDTREQKRQASLSDQSKEMPYRDEMMRGMRSVSSAGTSRRNFRGDSEFDTRHFSKDQDMKTLFFEDQNTKLETEENPVLKTKVTNELPVVEPVALLEKDVKDTKDSKDVQELKIGFWFKAKKNILNPPTPKREMSIQDKLTSSGMNFRKKRDTCKENKALLDKVSEVYKFKIGVINPQNPARILSSKSPLTERLPTKTVLNVHDLNLYKKDNRQSTSVSKQNSHRESLSIDLKGLEGRPPKLKSIVNILHRELKTDRTYSPARTRSSNSHIENRPVKGIPQIRKGLDSLAQFLNMKGSGIRLKQSRIDYM